MSTLGNSTYNATGNTTYSATGGAGNMHTSRVPGESAILDLFIALSMLFVLLRVYVKIYLSKQWNTDDTLLVLAQISFLVYSGLGTMAVRYGLGKLTQDVLLNDIQKAMFYWYMGEIFYTITALLIRYTIGLFLLRICSKKAHRYIIYGVLGMMTVFSIFFFLLLMFQCKPISFFWTQFDFSHSRTGKCVPLSVVPNAGIAQACVSFVADWVMALLPICILWNLQMNQRTKICVGLLLSLGVLAGVATMIRIPSMYNVARDINFLYTTGGVAQWSTAELGLGLLAAGAVALRPLFASIRLSSRLSSNDSRGYQRQHMRSPSQPINMRALHAKSGTLLSISSVGKPTMRQRFANYMRLSKGKVVEKEGANSILVQRSVIVQRVERGVEGKYVGRAGNAIEIGEGEQERGGWTPATVDRTLQISRMEERCGDPDRDGFREGETDEDALRRSSGDMKTSWYV